MQKVVGSSPIIRFLKALQKRGFRRAGARDAPAGGAGLPAGLHTFPRELDREIALTKLATLGLSLAEPTEKQREFEARWAV
jgi:hypothetical protein